MAELQLFPGLIPSVVKKLCNELDIKRIKRTESGRRPSYTITRKDLEKLLQKAGWILEELEGESYWIKHRVHDF